MGSTPQSSKPFNVAIVGGGITGLILAVSLLQHDIPFTVYESAAQFGEIGAGVGFGPNAVKTMGLISPKVKTAYNHCRTDKGVGKDSNSVWFHTRVGDRRKVTAEDGSGDDTFPYKGEKGFRIGDHLSVVHYSGLSQIGPVGGVHRAHYLDQLVKLLPPSVARFGKRLINITEAVDASGDAVLHFADGTTAQHTAVLACDGVKSPSRRLLLGPDYDPVFSGKCAYRGLVPMEKAREIIGDEKAMSSQIYFGYHGHLLTFPIEQGRTMNVVAFTSRESWTAPEWVVRVSKEQMNADFQAWGEDVKAIVSAMERQDVWALFDHPSAPTYYGTAPRICLVGDAAHAMTPHQGAGAGMCIEDCYILGNLLGEARSAADLDKAFKVYDEVRRPRTQGVVTTSREAGRLWDFELEGVMDDIDLLEENMRNRMGWIWEVDIAADMERAKEIFRQPA